MVQHARASISDFARTTRLLLTIRFIRSIGQGALAVDFTLYLRALGWSAPAISGVLSGALALGVVLTLIAGPLSDRGGRRRFLFVYEARPMACRAGGVFSGARRRSCGRRRWWEASGEAATAQRARSRRSSRPGWHRRLTPADRGPVYSLNAALGFLGNAAGAMIAGSPALVRGMLPGALAYRPLFLVSAVGSLLCCALILRTPGHRGGARADSSADTRVRTGRRTGWCCG